MLINSGDPARLASCRSSIDRQKIELRFNRRVDVCDRVLALRILGQGSLKGVVVACCDRVPVVDQPGKQQKDIASVDLAVLFSHSMKSGNSSIKAGRVIGAA